MISLENPINIALIFDQEVATGGGYQQGLNAALLALKINPKLAKLLIFHTKKNIGENLNNNGIKSELIQLSILKQVYLFIKTSAKYRPIYKILRLFFDFSFFEKFLINRDVDLVYFISPSRFALDLNKLNFIFTIWDLCHRDHIEFPEVKLKGEFENRELRIKYATKRAISLIVDSEYGKLNLCRKYNVDKERISIIPFEPLIDIKKGSFSLISKTKFIKKLNLKNKYIFYPAQIWPHKNHMYILKAIFLLENMHKTKINAIFAGGDKGNERQIKNYAEKLGIQKRIIFTGFVSNNELIYLYKYSLALVMPTYFGPTNIPPLEAFKIGVPTIYPDLNGLRDQIGNAGLLIDLNDPRTLSDCLIKLIRNKALRSTLIKKGFKISEKMANYDRLKVLNSILIPFINKYSNFKLIN